MGILNVEKLLSVLSGCIHIRVYLQITEGASSAMDDPEKGRGYVRLTKEDLTDAVNELRSMLEERECLIQSVMDES